MNRVENKTYYMQEVPAKVARELVKKYHYSGKVVANSVLHLGVFEKETDELVGCLQYGYPMNPARTPQKLVVDSNQHEMYELNRMAMTDEAPKFSESQAIGLSLKFIKRFRPEIKWLLSFSDGKQGNVGTIYQATNWQYHGYRLSGSFWELDGTVEHNVQIWSKYRQKDTTGRTTTEIICDTFDNVSKIESRQHIYIFPLARDVEIIPDRAEYPRKETEPTITRRTWYKKNGIKLDKPERIEY